MKKLILSIVIALTLIVTFAAPVFAWEYEDQIVADNDDFVYGVGADVGSGIESHSGGQLWQGDGYNLYQDDATDTGNLDAVAFVTYTPGEIDLPSTTQPWWFFPGSASGISPDTWYWGTEPRGYNIVNQAEVPYMGMEGQFTVEVLGSRNHGHFSWSTGWNEFPQILGEDVCITGEKNGTTITLEIPTGTEVSFPYRPGVFVTFLSVDVVNGEVVFNPKNMDFSEPVTLTVNGESVTFTEIRDGVPVL